MLQEKWHQIRVQWFPDRPDIDCYRVCWSNRPQKRTLASCNVKLKRVTVARELSHDSSLDWLEPVLYHEMCHAALDSRRNVKGRHVWHDSVFRELENRHPKITLLNQWITMGGWHKAVRVDRATRFSPRKKHITPRRSLLNRISRAIFTY